MINIRFIARNESIMRLIKITREEIRQNERYKFNIDIKI